MSDTDIKDQETTEEEVQEETNEESTQEDPKDRTTQQFEKLTSHNKQLKAERDGYKNLLDSLAPEEDEAPPQQPQAFDPQQYQNPVSKAPSANQYQNLNQQQINETFKSMIDEKGYMDGNKLLNVLQQMDDRARKAEEDARQARAHTKRMEQAQEKMKKSSTMEKVHEKYPQLDPDNEEVFNRDFYDVVRNDLIGQMMEGKEDPLEAADKWADKFLQTDMNKQQKEEMEQKQNKKKAINATRPRSSSMQGYYKDEEEDSLRAQVRKNKKGALAELLRRRGQ